VFDLYDQGLTQVQIAKAVDCSQAYVSHALSGRHSGVAKAARDAHEAAQEAAAHRAWVKYQEAGESPQGAATLAFYDRVRTDEETAVLHQRIEDEHQREAPTILETLMRVRADFVEIDKRMGLTTPAEVLRILDETIAFNALPKPTIMQIPLPRRPKWMPDVREPLTAAGQTELHLLHAMGSNRVALKEFWQRASTVSLTPRRITRMYDDLITLEYAAKQAKVEHAHAQLDAYTTSDNAQLFV
jgi:predicted transcriptional regulator